MDRVALITGGSRGIGAATALLAASAGLEGGGELHEPAGRRG